MIDDNNEFGKSYKDIYKRFIDLQNKEITELLDIKIDNGVLDCNCKQKIRIQNIKKNEIFVLSLPKKFSFINILFNNSYRKIIDNNDYKAYNQYNINLDLIEKNLTELLLKNIKILDEKDTITDFVYKNEEFNLGNIDVFITFNEKFETRDLTIDDKMIIYHFCMNNKENINLMKILIEDFNSFIILINNNTKINDFNNNEISEDTKIKNILSNLEEGVISVQFKEFFKDKDTFTIDKLVNIFEYFLKSIFLTFKNDINNYQTDLLEKQKDEIKLYFKKKKMNIITEKNLSKALRLLITLMFIKEEDKETKLKQNTNNVVNYLNDSEFWDKDIVDNNDFNKELNGIKIVNVQINQILKFYELLGGDVNKDEFNNTKIK